MWKQTLRGSTWKSTRWPQSDFMKANVHKICLTAKIRSVYILHLNMVQVRAHEVTYQPRNYLPLLIYLSVCGCAMMIAFVLSSLKEAHLVLYWEKERCCCCWFTLFPKNLLEIKLTLKIWPVIVFFNICSETRCVYLLFTLTPQISKCMLW